MMLVPGYRLWALVDRLMFRMMASFVEHTW